MNLYLSLSEVRFGALLVYSPRGQGEVSVKSRRIVRDGVKHDRPGILRNAVVKLVGVLETNAELLEFFGEETTLVPVPRSAPRCALAVASDL